MSIRITSGQLAALGAEKAVPRKKRRKEREFQDFEFVPYTTKGDRCTSAVRCPDCETTIEGSGETIPAAHCDREERMKQHRENEHG